MPNLKILSSTVVAVLVLVVVASILSNNSPTMAQTTSTAPPRHFYVTKTFHDGSHVFGSCVSGYHVASLWEIHEPSNLSYNTTLGITTADSGQGAPVDIPGYFRTGFAPDPGLNCNAWTTNSSAASGFAVTLPQVSGSSGFITQTAPWVEISESCDSRLPVWCVQN